MLGRLFNRFGRSSVDEFDDDQYGKTRRSWKAAAPIHGLMLFVPTMIASFAVWKGHANLVPSLAEVPAWLAERLPPWLGYLLYCFGLLVILTLVVGAFYAFARVGYVKERSATSLKPRRWWTALMVVGLLGLLAVATLAFFMPSGARLGVGLLAFIALTHLFEGKDYRLVSAYVHKSQLEAMNDTLELGIAEGKRQAQQEIDDDVDPDQTDSVPDHAVAIPAPPPAAEIPQQEEPRMPAAARTGHRPRESY